MERAKILLIVFLVVGSAAAQSEPDTKPSYTCDSVDKVPPNERCSFVSEQCDSEGGLPYTLWYYCHVVPHGAAACFFFTVLMGALLPLLFTLLGDTAEVYFSPIMTHVSQSIPKMRPRFAGVTFVAMGNGATDLSANITAIRNGDVLLSAGALTGAAMFVQCVVASEVMRASRGPVKCRGATLRDLGIYVASLILVLASFARGKITYWFIVGATLLYLTYAVWVFLGDEWHERGRPEALTVWRSFRTSVSGRLGGLWGRPTEESLPWALMEDMGPGRENTLTAPLVTSEEDDRDRDGNGLIRSRPSSPGPQGSQRPDKRPQEQHHHHLISARAYREMVWADLSSEDRGAAASTRAAARAEGGGRGRRNVRRGRLASRGGRGPHGHAVEMGRAEGGEAGGGRNGSPSPDGAGAGAGGSVGGGSGGVSQLLTLSSLNGSALAAPAPLDLAPAVLAPIRAAAAAASEAPTRTGGTAAAGDASEGLLTGGQPARQTGDATWGGEGSGGDSEVSSADGKYDSEDEAAAAAAGRDEEAGLLGGRRAGSWQGDEGDDDAGSGTRRRGLWDRLRYELTVGTSAEWEELPPDSLRRRWRTVTFPLLLPVYAALRFTIPFVDPASYSRRWLIATCVGAPLLVATYVAPGSWLAAVVALAGGGALAAGVGYFTAGEEDELPDWDLLGTGFAFGPAFFAVFGFLMGIIWIDIVASQVVGVISLLASLLRLPASVMGLTLLAWGNSLGDFFGNPAMARRGKPTMALTACFAGPLFNMLTSMALGFGSYFARRHVGYMRVELRPEVAIGGAFLMLYNLAVAVAGLMNRGSLPEQFYLFARGWYLAYLVVACVVGLWRG